MKSELVRLQERVVELEKAMQIIERIEDAERLAYTLTCASFALGISKRTLRRQIIAGEITPLDGYKLIDRDELVRWVKSRTQRSAESRAAAMAPRPRARRVAALSREALMEPQSVLA